VLGVTHERLVSSKEVERWRAFWKEEVAAL
jgi:hypothetical protein